MEHDEKAQFYKLLSGEICILFYHPAPLTCLLPCWCELYIYWFHIPITFCIQLYSTMVWKSNYLFMLIFFLRPPTMWVFEGPLCSGVVTSIYCSLASWKVFPRELLSTWMEINWGHLLLLQDQCPAKLRKAAAFLANIVFSYWSFDTPEISRESLDLPLISFFFHNL